MIRCVWLDDGDRRPERATRTTASPLLALLAGVLLVSSTAVPTAAAASAQTPASTPAAPAPTSATADCLGGNDCFRTTLTPRIGLGLPGRFDVSELSRTWVHVGVVAQFDATSRFGRYFELGSYIHYGFRPLLSRGTADVSGLYSNFLSGGGAFKVRLAISRTMRFRIVGYLGWGFGTVGVDDARSETAYGHGFDIGAALEFSRDIAPGRAINVHLGFLAQPVGWATLPDRWANLVRNGTDQKLRFSPLSFLTVGIDLFR